MKKNVFFEIKIILKVSSKFQKQIMSNIPGNKKQAIHKGLRVSHPDKVLKILNKIWFMFYNSVSSDMNPTVIWNPPTLSALGCPIKRENLCALKNSKAFLAQISQADTGATSSCAWCLFRLFPTSALKLKLTKGVCGLSTCPGDSLRTTANWELVPSSWEPKAHSSINRLCSLCSSCRGGSRPWAEGEWPQSWGIPLFCLWQREAGSLQLPLLSKCPHSSHKSGC